MNFKKLELVGFKSFFDRTTFFIQEGLTGIVGPNGCGKSNIVEALRWCMGETSAKSMRGSGMEDIIFSGTSNKPAKNISEVNITIDNSQKEGPGKYLDMEEIIIKRKIEREKGSKYFINEKEVRAKDVQTFFADLSTGAHSPSIISQGKIGMIVTAKPQERKSVLEEAAGISGIHIRRHEAETRLNAAENNLKRADELKKQQEKQLANLKKQAEEATKYREISEKIKTVEAGLFYLKLQEIENETAQVKVKLSAIDNEVGSIKKVIEENKEMVEEENKKLEPLKDKKIENLSSIQKINLEISSLNEKEKRVKDLNIKLLNNIKIIQSDLEREKSISLDASLNEKRILEEKNELLKTERQLFDIEKKSEIDLDLSRSELKDHQIKLDDFLEKKLESIDLKEQLKVFIKIDEINKSVIKSLEDSKLDEVNSGLKKINEILQNQIKNIEVIDRNDLSINVKGLIENITLSQERYASSFGKNQTIRSDSIKRKERIKNIDQELENWKDLKVNSEKMILELSNRVKKVELELDENQKNPEQIAINKGQNIQKLENTEKQNNDLEIEIEKVETNYIKANNKLREIEEKSVILRENKARLEATIEGIDQRKMDLIYLVKNELKLENINNLLSISDLDNLPKTPSLKEQEEKLIKFKKDRESLGSVNKAVQPK